LTNAGARLGAIERGEGEVKKIARRLGYICYGVALAIVAGTALVLSRDFDMT